MPSGRSRPTPSSSLRAARRATSSITSLSGRRQDRTSRPPSISSATPTRRGISSWPWSTAPAWAAQSEPMRGAATDLPALATLRLPSEGTRVADHAPLHDRLDRGKAVPGGVGNGQPVLRSGLTDEVLGGTGAGARRASDDDPTEHARGL